jgi:hypothetical protein
MLRSYLFEAAALFGAWMLSDLIDGNRSDAERLTARARTNATQRAVWVDQIKSPHSCSAMFERTPPIVALSLRRVGRRGQ